MIGANVVPISLLVMAIHKVYKQLFSQDIA